MQIKRLRLTGFKSFVDPADLRIEPGLTGVVGPNGCGKSNLLEALRWTMGEASARSLRGAGMEDVIFAGTATRPQREFAEVSMLVETDDGDEREVVRRIERGAGSAYRIDGRDVRAKDVGLLFADAATGAHSPALVSQGRIGAVIAAKPADRRQMLEEAAGIAGLHVRRKDAEGRLRATEANLERLDEIIGDQLARAGQLKRQARSAERYRALSGDIRTAEARLIFSRWREAAALADAARAEASAAEDAVRAAAEQQRAAAAYQTAAAETVAAARARTQAARETAGQLAQRLTAARADLATAERRLADIADTRARLAEDREREGSLAHDAAAALARLSDEGKALEARIDAAAKRGPDLEAALREAERLGRDADVALAQALAEQAQEAAERRVADAALAAARARAERAERDLARIVREGEALAGPAAFVAEREAAIATRVRETRAAEQARAVLAGAEQAEAAAAATRDGHVAARAQAMADLAQIDSEAAALAKATQASGKDRLLDRVVAAPGYERALAAALGDDLEAGLDRTAERHWAGAAPVRGDPVAPAGTVALSAEVEAPAELARRLAQVFVAATDDGAPLAVGQRLVTLDGKLRRWDGFVALSGGAAAAARLERVNRLRAVQAARPAAERALATAVEALEETDAAIVRIRRSATEARATLQSADAAIREAQRAEDRAGVAIERAEAAAADLARRRARAVDDHDEATAEVRRAEGQRTSLPDGSAVAGRVAILSRDADAARARTAAAGSDYATFARLLAQDRDRLAATGIEARDWRGRSGEAARRIAEVDKRAAALADEAAGLAPRPEAIGRTIAALEAEASAASADRDAAIAAEGEADAGLRATEARAQAAAEALADAREARAGLAARAENHEARRVEMARLSGERFECPPPLLPERQRFASETVRTPAEESLAHDRLLAERERLGPVNLVADTELAALEAQAAASAAERDELTQAVHRLRGSIGTLNREGRQRLLAAFEAVNGHFRRLFGTLFGGGEAHLALVDADDPLEAGLEIMAQPPGKKLQSLTLLSGGEQALTAVALIFGLFLTNPAPICVLDEVDAPLDDANIERFCDLLDTMAATTATRYLIVTHNAVTMSRMHRLFGVTMIERGVSRLVSVDLGGAERLLSPPTMMVH